MEQIFVVVTEYRLRNNDMSEVNKFLKENPQYIVKNMVPITRHHSPGYYGVVITVGEK